MFKYRAGYSIIYKIAVDLSIAVYRCSEYSADAKHAQPCYKVELLFIPLLFRLSPLLVLMPLSKEGAQRLRVYAKHA